MTRSIITSERIWSNLEVSGVELDMIFNEGGDEPEIVTVSLSHVELNFNSGLMSCIKEIAGQELVLQELVMSSLINKDLSVSRPTEVLD